MSAWWRRTCSEEGIAYQYEPAYEHKTASPLYRQYQPHFYLPEQGIYIEYYGIDRQGGTAPYVDREHMPPGYGVEAPVACR